MTEKGEEKKDWAWSILEVGFYEYMNVVDGISIIKRPNAHCEVVNIL